MPTGTIPAPKRARPDEDSEAILPSLLHKGQLVIENQGSVTRDYLGMLRYSTEAVSHDTRQVLICSDPTCHSHSIRTQLFGMGQAHCSLSGNIRRSYHSVACESSTLLLPLVIGTLISIRRRYANMMMMIMMIIAGQVGHPLKTE